jgi:hypothetical protein
VCTKNLVRIDLEEESLNVGHDGRADISLRGLRRPPTHMTKGYIAADVAIKTAYFSFVAAAFIFVSMLLLAGVHP